MSLPARFGTTGRQQGQPRPAAIGLIENLRQQTLGLTQGLVTAGRRRSIDNDQPQLMGRAFAHLPLQVAALTWPALEQGRQPVHRALMPAPGTPAHAMIDLPGTGSGIRPLAETGADAQGFFGQTGTSRRAAADTGCGGSSPHCPGADDDA